MKKSLSLILAFAMLFTAMLGILPSAAEDDGGALRITSANVQAIDSVSLFIAVNYSELYNSYDSAKSKVTVIITDRQGGITTLEPDDSVTELAGFPEDSVGFRLSSISAKCIGDVMTIQAFDGDKASGSPVTYSILEYIIKAKSLNEGNEAYITAIEALQTFGAEAQKAFDYKGDYALADESGELIDYGLVVLNGASVKKEIRKVGESYAPATDKSAPLLYDMDFNPVKDNTLTVGAGVQRFFYIEQSTQTPYSLDVTRADMSGFSAGYASSTVTKNLYTDGRGNTLTAEPDSADATVYSRHIVQLVKNGTGGGLSIVKDGVGNNLAIKLERKGANILYKTRLQKASSDSNKAILGDLFTFSVTIGKSGTAAMCKSGYRFRGDGTNTIALFSVTESNGVSRISSAVTATPIAKINGVEGENSFVTLHIVVNVKEGTLTYYSDSATPLLTVSSPNITDYIYSTASKSYGDILDFTFESDGTVLIQKTIYTKGNIFE